MIPQSPADLVPLVHAMKEEGLAAIRLNQESLFSPVPAAEGRGFLTFRESIRVSHLAVHIPGPSAGGRLVELMSKRGFENWDGRSITDGLPAQPFSRVTTLRQQRKGADNVRLTLLPSTGYVRVAATPGITLQTLATKLLSDSGHRHLGVIDALPPYVYARGEIPVIRFRSGRTNGTRVLEALVNEGFEGPPDPSEPLPKWHWRQKDAVVANDNGHQLQIQAFSHSEWRNAQAAFMIAAEPIVEELGLTDAVRLGLV